MADIATSFPGNRTTEELFIGMLVSFDLGITWEVVLTPLEFYDSEESAALGNDDPRWNIEERVRTLS